MATLTSKQQALVEEAAGIARSVIAPRAEGIDRERAYPSEGLAALGKSGLLGLLVPEASGGRGGGLTELALAAEEIGAACASTAMCFLMHACGTALIGAKATDEQAKRWLQPAAAGSTLTTLAFSEASTGAHFYMPEISAVRDNGGYRLDGRKRFVTSGGHANLYPVLVKASGGNGLDVLVLDRSAKGVSFDGDWRGVGMAGNSSIAMALDGVEVPAADLLGAEGDGQELVFNVVAPTFLIGLGAVNTGIARSALDDAASHATNRTYPTGQKLAEVPAIQRYLGEMGIAIEGARQVVRAAAAAADAGAPEALPLVMRAKVLATEAAANVTGTAMQVAGGAAYSSAGPIERHWRDARAGSVMAPTNDVLKEWLGKIQAGLPLF